MKNPGSNTILCSLLIFLFALIIHLPAYAQEAASQSKTRIDRLNHRMVPSTLALNAAHIFGPDQELDRIAATGVRYVRHGTGWQGIETTKGVYDFSKYEAFYNDMAKRGIGVIFILAYNNPLYEPHGAREILTDEGRAGFAAFASAFVGHFKGKNILWEIWNEPNTRVFWGTPPNSERIATEYVKLVKMAIPAMRKADPEAIILAGAVSSLWSKSYEWMTYVFKQGILEEDFDGWSLHPYGLKRPEDYIGAYDTVRNLMKEHGKISVLPPLLNSERGFPIHQDEGFVGGGVDSTMQEEYKAGHYVRQYLVDLLCDVRLTVWYQWTGKGYGITENGKELPAYKASQILVQELSGYQFTKQLDTGSSLDFVMEFENAKGKRKWVAWTTQPAGETPDKITPHPLHMKYGKSSATLTDIYGKTKPLNAKKGILPIPVSGHPVYVSLK